MSSQGVAESAAADNAPTSPNANHPSIKLDVEAQQLGANKPLHMALETDAHCKAGSQLALEYETPKTVRYMVKNAALCSFCFGMGMSVLFIHVGTTTLAAKEFQSTAAATLPFGEAQSASICLVWLN